MKALRLFVVRHGETAWTREHRYTGGTDVPLSERGQAQAEAVGRALAGEPIVAVYSSPLERARTSAEIIAKAFCLDVRIEPAFREMAFGAWEGLTRDEVVARFPEAYAAWRNAPHTFRGRDGEDLVAVDERVRAALDGIRRAHAGEVVVLVTHAVVIRLIVLQALGLGPARLWSVDASPAGLTELELSPEWVTLHRMNTLAHLEDLA